MGTKFLGTIEINEDLPNKKYVDDNNRLFLAQYDSTSYANVKAAIDADKNILINFSNNNNLLAATYATYVSGQAIYLYAMFVYGGQSMVTEVKLTPENAWSITQHSLQDFLVSGTNIKTINGTSLLGSGDITIGGGGSETYTMGWDQTNLALTLTDGTTTQTLPLSGTGVPTVQTSGNWLYKVYADGTFEAWYKATGQSLVITSQSGNLYRSDLQTLTLPTNMTDGAQCNIQHVSVNCSHNNYPTWGMLASIQTPTANTFKFYAMSGGSRSNSPNYTITAYVFGTLS